MQRIVTHLTAHGVPAETFLTDPSGRYLTLGSGHGRERRPSGTLGLPPFHFDAKERLTIVGHRGGLILLRGSEGTYSELDSIDPHTNHVVAITEHEQVRGKHVHRTQHFTELAQQTPPPTPTPLR